MSQRTTVVAVQSVLGTNWDGKRNLQPFIDAATVVVDRVSTLGASRGFSMVSAELEAVERWLSAHMYALTDKTYTSKSTAGSSASFVGQTGMRLDFTEYGQNAKLIDYSGSLEIIDKRKFASVVWGGKPACDELSYDERN